MAAAQRVERITARAGVDQAERDASRKETRVPLHATRRSRAPWKTATHIVKKTKKAATRVPSPSAISSPPANSDSAASHASNCGAGIPICVSPPASIVICPPKILSYPWRAIAEAHKKRAASTVPHSASTRAIRIFSFIIPRRFINPAELYQVGERMRSLYGFKVPQMYPRRKDGGLLKQAVKTAGAAVLSLYVCRWLGLPEGYWAVISAIIVMQSNLKTTLRDGLSRLAGTAIGAVVVRARQ